MGDGDGGYWPEWESNFGRFPRPPGPPQPSRAPPYARPPASAAAAWLHKGPPPVQAQPSTDKPVTGSGTSGRPCRAARGGAQGVGEGQVAGGGAELERGRGGAGGGGGGVRGGDRGRGGEPERRHPRLALLHAPPRPAGHLVQGFRQGRQEGRLRRPRRGQCRVQERLRPGGAPHALRQVRSVLRHPP